MKMSAETRRKMSVAAKVREARKRGEVAVSSNGHFADSVKAEIARVRGELDRLGKYVLSLEMLETKS